MSGTVISNITLSPYRQLKLLLGRVFKGFSWPIFLAMLALSCIGITAIYLAEHQLPDPASEAKPWQLVLANGYLKQLVFLLSGLLLFFLVAVFDYRRIGRYSYWFFAVSIVLLVLVCLVPPAQQGTAVHRWFEIGPLRLQPSEISKIAFILALAWYLRFRKSYRTFLGFLWPFSFALVPMFLIVIEPDLGTSLLFLPTLIAILFAAGARKRHIGAVVLMGILALPVFWLKMDDYQKSRIVGWLKQGQQSVRSGSGFQLTRSLIAIGTGGVYGQPWGQAELIKHDLLIYDHTDFVFAVIGAQFGLAGASVVLLLYLVIFGFGLRVAQANYDPFGRLLAVGIVAMLAVQASINIAMTLGLLPITGMTLPFISYGGSSLWSCLMAVGLLINVGKHRPLSLAQKPFEFDSHP